MYRIVLALPWTFEVQGVWLIQYTQTSVQATWHGRLRLRKRINRGDVVLLERAFGPQSTCTIRQLDADMILHLESENKSILDSILHAVPVISSKPCLN